MRLQVVADQSGSKHTGDSRNRGKAGHPVWRSRRWTVEGMELRNFGESEVRGGARAETCFHFRTGITSVMPVAGRVPTAEVSP